MPIGGELRPGFHRHLDDVDGKVRQLFALVTESLAAATAALLDGDREQAEAAAQRDAEIDELDLSLQDDVVRTLHLQSPAVRDLRYLVTVLRVVPELERSGDLAEHIAKRAARGLGAQLSPRARGLVQQMGSTGVELWHGVALAWAERDVEACTRLEALDDELDDLSRDLCVEATSGGADPEVVLQLGLVARFYERLGDHAVHIAERIPYMVTGSR